MTFLRLVNKKKTNEDINNSSFNQAKIISKDVPNYPEVKQVTLLQTFEGIIEQHRSLFASIQGIEVSEMKQITNADDIEKELKNQKRSNLTSKQNNADLSAKHLEDIISDSRKSTGTGKRTKTGSSKSREGRVGQCDKRKKEKKSKKENTNACVDRKSPVQGNDSEKKVEKDSCSIPSNSLHSSDFTKNVSVGKSNRLNLEKVNSLSSSNPRAKFRRGMSSRSLESKQSSCAGSLGSDLDDIAKYGYENVSIRNLYAPSRSSESDLDDITNYGYETVSIRDLNASCNSGVPAKSPVVQRKVGRRPSLTAKIVAEWNLHGERMKEAESETSCPPQSKKKGKSTKSREQKEEAASATGQKALQSSTSKLLSPLSNEDNVLLPDNRLNEDFSQRISFTDVCGGRWLDSHALQYNRRSDPMFCTNEDHSSDFSVETEHDVDSNEDVPRQTIKRRTSLSGSSLAPVATAVQRKLTGRNQNVINRAAVRRNSLGRSQTNSKDKEEIACIPYSNESSAEIAEVPKRRTQKMVRRASLL